MFLLFVLLFIPSANEELIRGAFGSQRSEQTQQQRKSHRHQSVQKVNKKKKKNITFLSQTRKRKMRFQDIESEGNPIAGATMAIKQNKPQFPSSEFVINNTDYQNWFTKRFAVATFGNQLKWYSNEKSPEKKTTPSPTPCLISARRRRRTASMSAATTFYGTIRRCSRNGCPPFRRSTAGKRINSVVNWYQGEFIAWDVVNEKFEFFVL